jgi:hypothetical protein
MFFKRLLKIIFGAENSKKERLIKITFLKPRK